MPWTRFGLKRDKLWQKCGACGELNFKKDLAARHMVCAECGHHMTLAGRQRIEITADEGSFEEFAADLEASDHLEFVDRSPYPEKLEKALKKTGQKEAVIVGTATIEGIPVVLGVMDFSFLGGSMGCVVGEKIALAAEKALELNVPLITFASSGGARMHEGALSLMQMGKTCGALARLHEAKCFYISVLAHPTTGGVTASFASVADVIIAEPGALICFAGPRVIQTTIKQELPKGFQRAEFLLEKGQIDMICTREEMRSKLASLLAYSPQAQLPQDKPAAEEESA